MSATDTDSESAWQAPEGGDPGGNIAWGWLALIASLALLYAGSATPLPGVDSWLVPPGQARLLGGYPPLVFLVLVRWVAGAVESDRARAAAPFGYLGLTALWAWKLALDLEASSVGYSPVVLEPGLAFQLVTVATLLGAGALLWLLADWVSRSGLGEGGALIAGMWFGLGTVQFGLSAGMDLGSNRSFAVGVLLPGLSSAAVLAAMTVRSPEWPLRLPSLTLRSWAHAALLPPAVGLIGWQALDWLGFVEPLNGCWASVLAAAMVIRAVLAGARARSAATGVLAVLTVGLTMGPPALGVLASGAFQRASGPGPFAGTGTLEVTLRSQDPGPSDADRMRHRLAALRVDATVEGAGGELRVQARGVARERELLAWLVRPGRFSLRAVDEQGTRQLGQGLQPSLSDGQERVDYCWAEQACDPLVLEAAALTHEHVDDVWVAWDANVQPMLWITLDGDGRQRLLELTEDRVGQRIALSVDDVRSVPTVREPIPGGELTIDLGGEADPEWMATVLQAVIGSGPIEGHWVY